MDAFILKDSVTGSMTDEEFLRFCLENKDLRIERNSNLEIIIMSPTFTLGGFYSGEVFGQLSAWNRLFRKGLVFDSSTGFTLSDRSVLSPDASWVSRSRWDALTEEQKNQFAPLCPEFIIEVLSKSDHLDDLKNKMNVWIANGAQLAWLIDPKNEVSFIFRPNKPEEKIEGFDRKIMGEGPVEGFELDLTLLKP
jgi:Uma2 family endonuclease